jgi:hypothetical protein
VEIDQIVKTTPAGKRKINTEKANETSYQYKWKWNSSELFSSKKEALAHLKEMLDTADEVNLNPNEPVKLIKVQSLGILSYSESSKLPTFTVKGKRVQRINEGKVKGYVFFGVASY